MGKYTTHKALLFIRYCYLLLGCQNGQNEGEMMLETALYKRLKRKKTICLDDFVLIRNELAKVDKNLAETLRDDIWNIHGKFEGVGLRKIPAKDIVERALELERMAKEGVELHPIKWTFEEREEREKEQLTDRKSIQKVHGKYRKN